MCLWIGKNVCDIVLKFVLNEDASPVNDVVLNGVGYIDKERKAHIVSPRYIYMILEHEQLLISSSTNWRKLEQLTPFRLKFKKDNTAKNRCNESVSIPRPTYHCVQCQIGDMPTPELKAHDVCLMALAPKHPVIYAVLFDWQQKSKLNIFYIQTSFSRYSQHKKKREDMETTIITGDLDKTVQQLYGDEI